MACYLILNLIQLTEIIKCSPLSHYLSPHSEFSKRASNILHFRSKFLDIAQGLARYLTTLE
jgi:hypothetical protein